MKAPCIVHCCTQRAASHWVLSVLSDPVVAGGLGLKPTPFRQWWFTQQGCVGQPFPEIRYQGDIPPDVGLASGQIGLAFYLSYENYMKLNVPTGTKAFFVLRDPRDVLVSFYKRIYSYPRSKGLPAYYKRELWARSQNKGLRWLTTTIAGTGLFNAQRSWIAAEQEGKPGIKLFRYELLVSDPRTFLDNLLGWVGLVLPRGNGHRLRKRHRYSQYKIAFPHHYHKGIHGTWQEYFGRNLTQHFRDRTGDLVEFLGYNWDRNNDATD